MKASFTQLSISYLFQEMARGILSVSPLFILCFHFVISLNLINGLFLFVYRLLLVIPNCNPDFIIPSVMSNLC